MTKQHESTFTIGTLARKAQVHVETIRYYQGRGLVSLPARPQGGARRYGDDDVERLRFIRSAQGLGFSLEEVGELLALEQGAHCDEARTLGEAKLAEVGEKIVQLQRIEGILQASVAACRGHGQVVCPLIASLHTRQSS